MRPQDIEELVERAQAGERAAFDGIVERFSVPLRAVVAGRARQASSDEDIDDAVQEALLLAYQALPKFEWQGEDAFFGWLARIARHAWIDQQVKANRQAAAELPAQLVNDDVSAPRKLRRGERFDRLKKAMAALPPDYREALMLARIEQLKVREIAKKMDRTEYAIKHLLARATTQLRESFGHTESLGLPPRRFDGEATNETKGTDG